MSTGVGLADRLPRLTNPVFPAAEALAGMATSNAPKATNTADSQGRMRRFTCRPSQYWGDCFPPPPPGGLERPFVWWPKTRAISLLPGRHEPKERGAHSRGGLRSWQPVRSGPDQLFRDSGAGNRPAVHAPGLRVGGRGPGAL